MGSNRDWQRLVALLAVGLSLSCGARAQAQRQPQTGPHPALAAYRQQLLAWHRLSDADRSRIAAVDLGGTGAARPEDLLAEIRDTVVRRLAPLALESSGDRAQRSVARALRRLPRMTGGYAERLAEDALGPMRPAYSPVACERECVSQACRRRLERLCEATAAATTIADLAMDYPKLPRLVWTAVADSRFGPSRPDTSIVEVLDRAISAGAPDDSVRQLALALFDSLVAASRARAAPEAQNLEPLLAALRAAVFAWAAPSERTMIDAVALPSASATDGSLARPASASTVASVLLPAVVERGRSRAAVEAARALREISTSVSAATRIDLPASAEDLMSDDGCRPPTRACFEAAAAVAEAAAMLGDLERGGDPEVFGAHVTALLARATEQGVRRDVLRDVAIRTLRQAAEAMLASAPAATSSGVHPLLGRYREALREASGARERASLDRISLDGTVYAEPRAMLAPLTAHGLRLADTVLARAGLPAGLARAGPTGASRALERLSSAESLERECVRLRPRSSSASEWARECAQHAIDFQNGWTLERMCQPQALTTAAWTDRCFGVVGAVETARSALGLVRAAQRGDVVAAFGSVRAMVRDGLPPRRELARAATELFAAIATLPRRTGSREHEFSRDTRAVLIALVAPPDQSALVQLDAEATLRAPTERLSRAASSAVLGEILPATLDGLGRGAEARRLRGIGAIVTDADARRAADAAAEVRRALESALSPYIPTGLPHADPARRARAQRAAAANAALEEALESLARQDPVALGNAMSLAAEAFPGLDLAASARAVLEAMVGAAR